MDDNERRDEHLEWLDQRVDNLEQFTIALTLRIDAWSRDAPQRRVDTLAARKEEDAPVAPDDRDTKLILDKILGYMKHAELDGGDVEIHIHGPEFSALRMAIGFLKNVHLREAD